MVGLANSMENLQLRVSDWGKRREEEAHVGSVVSQDHATVTVLFPIHPVKRPYKHMKLIGREIYVPAPVGCVIWRVAEAMGRTAAAKRAAKASIMTKRPERRGSVSFRDWAKKTVGLTVSGQIYT